MRIVRDNEENGNNLEKHFRELRNLETVPSSDLWDNLEDRLDEDRERVKHDHWYKALILLLIPFTVINILLTYNLGSYNKKVTELNDENNLQQRSQSSSKDVPNSLNKPGSWGSFFNGDFLALFNALTIPVEVGIEADDDGSELSHNSADAFEGNAAIATNPAAGAVQPGQQLTLQRQMQETSATSNDVIKYHSRKIVNEGASSVKGFHFGIEGGINNNWMLHKDNALHPLIGNKIHRKFDVGATYGISAGYDFSKRFGIEAEWIIHSRQGQQYSELKYGKIRVNGEVNLDYMHVPVMFKYKWTKVSPRSLSPRVLNLVTGVQYSRLMDAHVVQNGLDMEKVSDLFNRDELGLLIGTEYDIYFHRNYYVSLGIRASVSTDARAFPYFNSENTETYNLLIGVNASFNYLALRKKKD